MFLEKQKTLIYVCGLLMPQQLILSVARRGAKVSAKKEAARSASSTHQFRKTAKKDEFKSSETS